MVVKINCNEYEYVFRYARNSGRTLALLKTLNEIGGGYLIVKTEAYTSLNRMASIYPNIKLIPDSELIKLQGIGAGSPILVDNSVYEEVLIRYKDMEEELKSTEDLLDKINETNYKLTEKNKELHSKIKLYEDFLGNIESSAKEIKSNRKFK